MGPEDPHWHSAVEAARKVQSADEINWDDEADVVVVGFGGAGAAAALQSVELGQSVICLDRFHGGGATEASGGVLYAGGGTWVQKEAGVEDDPDNMFRYLKMETNCIVSDETLRDFCEKSAETVDWLTKYNVDFRSSYWPKKTSYPGVDYFLYHSDNTLAPAYRKNAKPAARGHRGYSPPELAIKATSLGGPIYRPMRAAVAKAGGKIHEQAEARQLVVDANNNVIGVKTLQFDPGSEAGDHHKALLAKAAELQAKWPPIIPGSSFFLKRAAKYMAQAAELEQTQRKECFYRARNGVVIAAGGFIFNRKMVDHYAPTYSKAYPLGTNGDDGAGIRLGQTAGGAVDNMDRLTPWRFINPPIAWAHGIVVNEQGERFTDEMLYGATLGVQIALDHNGRAWTILDQALVKEALEQIKGGKVLPFQRDLARLNFWFAAKKAKSLDALAQKVGIDAAGLKKSVDAYNRAAKGEAEDTMGKDAKDIAPILKPPFYAIDIGIGAKLFPCPTLTLGGLKVNEQSGQVMREDDAPVGGLYAAGRSAIGVCSWNYISGLSIADCVYSGRRAAVHINSNSSAAKVA